MSERRPVPRPRRAALLFAAWACVGAAAALGIAALLTIGVVLLGVAAVLAAVLLRRAVHEWVPVLGLGLGAAFPVGYLGWLNRDGPGTVCHRVTAGTSCTGEWAPWPFYVVALTLAVASVALFLHLTRADSRRRVAPGGGGG